MRTQAARQHWSEKDKRKEERKKPKRWTPKLETEFRKVMPRTIEDPRPQLLSEFRKRYGRFDNREVNDSRKNDEPEPTSTKEDERPTATIRRRSERNTLDNQETAGRTVIPSNSIAERQANETTFDEYTQTKGWEEFNTAEAARKKEERKIRAYEREMTERTRLEKLFNSGDYRECPMKERRIICNVGCQI